MEVPGYKINLSPVPPKFPTDGMAKLVLPVVDKLLNMPVVQFNVPFIVPPNDVILPETSKVVEGFVFPIPNILFVLSHVKFGLCKIDVAAFPINIWFAVNVVAPVPPLEIANVPEIELLTFIFVNPAPEPTKLDADKVLFEVSHVKFALCKILVEPLPINIWFVDNVVVPIPPLVIDNVPAVALLTFKLDIEAPEPVKVLADIYVADIVVPVKIPVNVPPVNGKNKLYVEDIGVPFLYISLQFIFPKTSNL